MSDHAAQGITNAVACIEYATRHAGNRSKATQAFDNARQALNYAENAKPSREQRAMIQQLRMRLPEWERHAEAST